MSINKTTTRLAVFGRLAAGRRVRYLITDEYFGELSGNFKPQTGPGTELERLLAWFAEPSDKCGCKQHAATMNAWGVDGCREHFETIVGWLVVAAELRGWPGGVITRAAAGVVVTQAIRNAER